MIKKIIAIFGILAFVGLGLMSTLLVSCEKDDVCTESMPRTPQLVIEFFDLDNPTTPKDVVDLLVIAEIFLEDENPSALFFTNENKIKIPLLVNEDSTTYLFRINSKSENPQLNRTDLVTFQYNRRDVFINRACGFKTLFDFEVFNPITIQGALPGPNPWILGQQIINVQVNPSEDAHVNFFF